MRAAIRDAALAAGPVARLVAVSGDATVAFSGRRRRTQPPALLRRSARDSLRDFLHSAAFRNIEPTPPPPDRGPFSSALGQEP